jgi:hypothetical protein
MVNRKNIVNTQDIYIPVIASGTGSGHSENFSEEQTTEHTISGSKSTRDAFWLFELEDDGTVIYSRPHLAEFGDGSDALEVHNFFDETFGFENIAEYRQNFRSFVKSNKAVASFVWRRSSAGESVDTKVLMTRVFQTGACPPTCVVMMEIRGC